MWELGGQETFCISQAARSGMRATGVAVPDPQGA